MENAGTRIGHKPDDSTGITSRRYAPRGLRGPGWPSPSAYLLARMHERAQERHVGGVELDEEFESGTTPTLEEVTGKSEKQILAEVRRERAERNRAIRDARLDRTHSRLSVADVAPVGTVSRTRSRRSRGKPIRTRGSRRTVASSSDDDGGGEPPGNPWQLTRTDRWPGLWRLRALRCTWLEWREGL